MNTLKSNNMMKAYAGFKGPQTMQHISKLVGPELAELLTGKQLGLVMNAINNAYHEGKASTGAEVIDGEAVYINSLGQLYELSDLKRLSRKQVRTELKDIPLDSSDCWSGAHGKWVGNKYYQLSNIRNSDGTKLQYSLPKSCKNGEYIADGVCIEEVAEFN